MNWRINMGREQIKVEYVDHMGTDLSTVNSARVSFDKESDWEDCSEDPDMARDAEVLADLHHTTIREQFAKFSDNKGVLKTEDKGLVKYLASHHHTTPSRHNAVTIRCHAPIFIARQLGKHQAGLSWNEVSRRYVDTPPEFFVPDEWRGRPDGSIKQGSGVKVSVKPFRPMGLDFADHNTKFLDAISGYYNHLLQQGVAPEMARMVLPQSMMTSWYWTGNLLAFAHVYKERIAEGAQLEAQWFAEDLDKVIRPLFPESWSALVD